MYLSFYHLNRNPFQISTNPQFLWQGEKHKEALATLRYGILDNKGFLLLTGDVGTGKTTLINALLNSLDEDVLAVTIPDPGLDQLDLYYYIAAAFGIREQFSSKGQFLVLLSKFLHQMHELGKKVLLIIDEAQRLSPVLLEEIRLLSNIERPDTKLINIFFVGQNEFNDILLQEENRALRQRVTVSYDISPLSIKETGEYLRHRLKVAGCDRQLFNAGAIHHIHAFSKGYPRLINVIADRALLTGYVEEAQEIGGKVVLECANELQIRRHKASSSQSSTPARPTASGAVVNQPPPLKVKQPSSPAVAGQPVRQLPVDNEKQIKRDEEKPSASTTVSEEKKVEQNKVSAQAKSEVGPREQKRANAIGWLAALSLILISALAAIYYLYPNQFWQRISVAREAISSMLQERDVTAGNVSVQNEENRDLKNHDRDGKPNKKNSNAMGVADSARTTEKKNASGKRKDLQQENTKSDLAYKPLRPLQVMDSEGKATVPAMRPETKSPVAVNAEKYPTDKDMVDGNKGKSDSSGTGNNGQRGSIQLASVQQSQELIGGGNRAKPDRDGRQRESTTGVSHINPVIPSNVDRLAEVLDESFLDKKQIINFDYDSNNLSQNGAKLLDKLAMHLQLFPFDRLVIRGYSDGLGTDHYNKSLSLFRATMVKSYLLAKGISTDKMITQGLGAKNPVASNQTIEGRRANRRVEVKIIR